MRRQVPDCLQKHVQRGLFYRKWRYPVEEGNDEEENMEANRFDSAFLCGQLQRRADGREQGTCTTLDHITSYN